MESASASMAKRFQLLFVLPKSAYSIIAAYLAVSLLLSLVYEFSYGLNLTSMLIVFASVILQGIVLQVVITISSHLSPIATTRRVAASLTIVNGFWLAVSLLVFAVKGFDPVGVSYLAPFSPFVSLAFGVLIFWPVFTDSIWLALSVSALNTMPLVFVFSTFYSYGGLQVRPSSLALGVSFLIVTIGTLSWINGTAKKSLGMPSFRLLKAFLDAWINLNGGPLESILSEFGTDGSVSTYLIEFNRDPDRKVALVVPEVHPGPFTPVGAYDLPDRICRYLRGKGYEEAIVLHGAVDHSLNLISHKDVEQYLSQLTVPPTGETFSAKVSVPLSTQSGDVVVTGWRFGDSLCLFLSVPKGSEDYPSTFREAVKNLCAKIGYRRVITVDAHNSIGENPSDALQADALEGVKRVASELFSMAQFEFDIGYSSKQFTFASINDSDIGAGGLACLVIRVDGMDYALVSADSNNSLVGLREQIQTALDSKSIRLLEFCTSDSHFNAARIRNKRGYLVLGETTAPAKIVEEVMALADKALADMGRASLGLYEWVSKVRLPSPDLLNRMEATLTSAISTTKRGLAFIFSFLLVEIILLLLL